MALSQMTPQQYADLVLQYWQTLRNMPKRERESRLDELLEGLKGDKQHGRQ